MIESASYSSDQKDIFSRPKRVQHLQGTFGHFEILQERVFQIGAER